MLKSKKCAKFCENQTKRCKVSMAGGRNEVVDGKKIKQKKKDKENNHSLCAVPKKNTMQMHFYLY